MLQELLETVSSLAFEEFGALRLQEAAWPGRAGRLQFRVWPGEAPIEREGAPEPRFEDWLVECRDVRAALLKLERTDSLTFVTEHPLLWSYRQGETQLAFQGRALDPAAVVTELWAAHRAAAGDWIPFGEHLNLFDPAAPVVGLLETTSGILASGPRPLMDAYAQVLRRHDLTASFIGGHRLGLWEGEGADFGALLFGRSYVIGAGFAANRVDVGAPVA